MANMTTLNREETEKMNTKTKLNDFTEPLHKAERSVAEAYHTGQEAVADWIQDESVKLKSAYHDAEKGMNQAIDSVNSTVKKYPFGSIAVGFGLGCLAGYLMRTASKRTS